MVGRVSCKLRVKVRLVSLAFDCGSKLTLGNIAMTTIHTVTPIPFRNARVRKAIIV